MCHCVNRMLYYVQYELKMSFRFEHNFQMTDSIDVQVDDEAGTVTQRKSMFGKTRQVILILHYCGSYTLDMSTSKEV